MLLFAAIACHCCFWFNCHVAAVTAAVAVRIGACVCVAVVAVVALASAAVACLVWWICVTPQFVFTGVCKKNGVFVVVCCSTTNGITTVNNNNNTDYFANTGISVLCHLSHP